MQNEIKTLWQPVSNKQISSSSIIAYNTIFKYLDIWTFVAHVCASHYIRCVAMCRFNQYVWNLCTVVPILPCNSVKFWLKSSKLETQFLLEHNLGGWNGRRGCLKSFQVSLLVKGNISVHMHRVLSSGLWHSALGRVCGGYGWGNVSGHRGQGLTLVRVQAFGPLEHHVLIPGPVEMDGTRQGQDGFLQLRHCYHLLQGEKVCFQVTH